MLSFDKKYQNVTKGISRMQNNMVVEENDPNAQYIPLIYNDAV